VEGKSLCSRKEDEGCSSSNPTKKIIAILVEANIFSDVVGSITYIKKDWSAGMVLPKFFRIDLCDPKCIRFSTDTTSFKKYPFLARECIFAVTLLVPVS
jgi:hypothetical protein